MIKYFLPSLILLLMSSAVSAENSITYPQRAWHLELSGKVLAAYDISADGKAKNVRILESNPKFLFDDDVKSQIYKWKFPKDSPQNDVRVTIHFER